MSHSGSSFQKSAAAAMLAACALVGAASANAGVSWSIGINAPGYYAPEPVYVAPPPYYAPPPLYYAAPPTYYRPAPVYSPAPGYYGPPVEYERGHHGWRGDDEDRSRGGHEGWRVRHHEERDEE